ncbi:hypothetical protein RJT34_05857 [Clitoria ternatea]|uniref:BZIP domain-containing protein n=1 Tax=Clitoria ternatea TaxID=43366 RepID=A0AAN9K469_CLITE
METGEESTAKPSKPSTSSTQIPLALSYPDWSSSMQAYYAPGATPPVFASTVASPTPHPYLWGSQHPLIPPYGTPVAYPAIYPAIYHPGMAMVSYLLLHTSITLYPTSRTTQHGTEFVGKGPNAKDRVSARSWQRMSANTGSKSGDNEKAGSGSGNDGITQSTESGSDGSSDASDENTIQQESATNKGSFDQMLVDGANARNNSVSTISESSVPRKPAAVDPSRKAVHNQSGASGSLGEQWIQDERELKIQKRKQSNRESAGRSRPRKQAECEELQKWMESLGSQNQTLGEELQRISEECMKLASENNSIKEELDRLCGPEAVANL